MKTLFTNAHLVTAGLELENAALLAENGRIAGIYAAGTGLPAADATEDLAGQYLLPGFIDIHNHGCAGGDFADATDEAVRTIGMHKLSEGVTSMLATTLTLSDATIAEIFHAVARYTAADTPGARMLGVHMEGPYINPEGAGAQNPEFLRHPDLEAVKRFNRIYPVRKVSFSPELPGGIEFTRALAQIGIMPSGAHSTADFALFEQARAAGLKHLTHFCNVMTPLHHLRPGMVGGGLLADDVYVEIIADGIHLTREMLTIILKLKGSHRVMMITDAMRAAGMPDGDYTLGGLPVEVRNRKATLQGSATVAGSVLEFAAGLRNLRRLNVLPDCELIRVAGANQAHSLKLTGVGELKTGFMADLVIADADWQVRSTWVEGVKRYECGR